MQKKSYDLAKIKAKLKHLVEHLGEISQQQMCSVKKAKLFGLLFNKLPTYDKLTGGTPDKSIFTDVNSLFLPNFKSTSPLATSRGIEPRFPD